MGSVRAGGRRPGERAGRAAGTGTGTGTDRAAAAGDGMTSPGRPMTRDLRAVHHQRGFPLAGCLPLCQKLNLFMGLAHTTFAGIEV